MRLYVIGTVAKILVIIIPRHLLGAAFLALGVQLPYCNRKVVPILVFMKLIEPRALESHRFYVLTPFETSHFQEFHEINSMSYCSY